jgi:hypothetical protein
MSDGTEEVTTHNEEEVETTSGEATAPGSEETTEESEEQQEETAEKKDGKMKRIAAQSYKLRQAQRREQEANEKILELEEKLAQKPQTEADAEPPPKQEDFETDAEFISAMIKHGIRTELRTLRGEEIQREQSLTSRREAVEVQKQFAEKTEAGYDKYGERFDDAIHDVEYSSDMMKHISQSDLMADIAMHLLDNPKEAQDMGAMSEIQLVRALTTIEHNLKATSSSSKKKTDAPATIKPVSGNAAPGKTDYSKMSGDEYLKKRAAERAEARKRV